MINRAELWRLKLEDYDFEIIYKKSIINTNTDALSRAEINLNESDEIETMIEQLNNNNDVNYNVRPNRRFR